MDEYRCLIVGTNKEFVNIKVKKEKDFSSIEFGEEGKGLTVFFPVANKCKSQLEYKGSFTKGNSEFWIDTFSTSGCNYKNKKNFSMYTSYDAYLKTTLEDGSLIETNRGYSVKITKNDKRLKLSIDSHKIRAKIAYFETTKKADVFCEVSSSEQVKKIAQQEGCEKLRNSMYQNEDFGIRALDYECGFVRGYSYDIYKIFLTNNESTLTMNRTTAVGSCWSGDDDNVRSVKSDNIIGVNTGEISQFILKFEDKNYSYTFAKILDSKKLEESLVLREFSPKGSYYKVENVFVESADNRFFEGRSFVNENATCYLSRKFVKSYLRK
jgi:hypothetical protein